MRGYDSRTFGRAFAAVYDGHYEDRGADPTKLAALTRLAEGGAVADVGCGTGRIALALAEEGLTVTALDASPEMLEVLRGKPGAERLDIRECDVARESIPGSYALGMLLFETLIMVGDHDAQRRTIANVAETLEPGGRLVVEFSVLEPEEWFRYTDSVVQVDQLEAERLVLRASRYDRVDGRLDIQEVVFRDDRAHLLPVEMHPTDPKDLDAWCRDVGLQPEARWSDWHGTRWSRRDGAIIAVYRRA